MSNLSELIETWNEFMPQAIRESDVKNPTESSFRRLLIVILKKLFVDTSSYESMDNENSLKTQRKRLVYTINHFLQIAFANSQFCYIDLVQPSE
jgi:hypothetical protein